MPMHRAQIVIKNTTPPITEPIIMFEAGCGTDPSSPGGLSGGLPGATVIDTII